MVAVQERGGRVNGERESNVVLGFDSDHSLAR